MQKKSSNEELCLKIITGLSVIIALFALTAGVLTHSTALLLDGTLAIFDTAAIFITLLTAKFLKESHNNKSYPYGYFKVEPLIIAVQAAFIVAVCLLSLFHSLKDLFHHTAFITNYAWGFSYTIFTIIACLFGYAYISMINKKEKSLLLELQAISWKYGAFLTSTLLLGFIASYYLVHVNNLTLNALARYIDPLMTLIVVVFIIKTPIMLFRSNIEDLLDRSPRNAYLQKKIHQEMLNIIDAQKVHFDIDSIKIRRAGRAYFISVTYFGAPTTTLADIETINKAIQEKIQNEGRNFYIDFIPKLKN